MDSLRTVVVFACALAVFSLCAQNSPTQSTNTDDNAFAAIEQLFPKTMQGRDNPTEDDFKARREAGIEMSRRGRQFLKDYPSSKHCEDAEALANIGLFTASLTGDTAATEELQKHAAEIVKDAKTPESLKLHTFALSYIAQWAKKNNRRNLNQGSAEFQKVYTESFFAAVDVLTDKDAIFKMLLLQAKSGREMTPDEKKDLAARVLKHPAASESIKAVAQQILSGEKPYAIGKPLDISFTAVDGRKVDLKDLKGKVVLLDFWATWCGPCVAELPAIKKTYDAYHARGFEIVGISLDTKKQDLLDFIAKKEMPWPQYFDGQQWNNEISFRYGISGVPATWLIDKNGNLRNDHANGHDLGPEVEALLQEK